MRTDFDAQWEQLAEEVMSGMKEWRLQHPRQACVRSSGAGRAFGKNAGTYVQDAVLAQCGGYQGGTGGRTASVRECGGELAERTQAVRHLVTQHNQTLEFERSYGVCPHAEQAFFPLDDELELLPGELTPSLQVSIAAR